MLVVAARLVFSSPTSAEQPSRPAQAGGSVGLVGHARGAHCTHPPPPPGAARAHPPPTHLWAAPQRPGTAACGCIPARRPGRWAGRTCRAARCPGTRSRSPQCPAPGAPHSPAAGKRAPTRRSLRGAGRPVGSGLSAAQRCDKRRPPSHCVAPTSACPTRRTPSPQCSLTPGVQRLPRQAAHHWRRQRAGATGRKAAEHAALLVCEWPDAVVASAL